MQDDEVKERTSVREDDARRDTAELIVSAFKTAQKGMEQVAHLVVESLGVMKDAERSNQMVQQQQMQCAQRMTEKVAELSEKIDIFSNGDLEQKHGDGDAEEMHRVHVGERQQTQQLMAGLKAKLASDKS